MAIDYKRLRNWPFADVEHTYDWKDSALYALGVGYGHDPMDEKQLRFVYEERMVAAPTIPVVLATHGFWVKEQNTGVDWVRVLHGEQRKVLAWWPKVEGGDAHAGHTETSMMLALSPELVRMDKAEAGNTAPLMDLLDEMAGNGVRAVSPNGVLGDPTGASAGHGRAVLTRLSIDLVAAVDEWWE